MFAWVTRSVIYLAVLAGAGVLASDASAAVAWNESVHGDISGDRLAPTPLVLAPATNSVIGSVVAGDLDYVTVKVLPGEELINLFLQSYAGDDFTAFIAIQQGTTFTAAPPFPSVSSLLGYAHFGPGAGFFAGVGSDLLYPLATAAGAIGFSAPLPSGDYSFWIQQTGGSTSYQLDFVTTPEPTAAALVACGLWTVLLGSARARRSMLQ